MSVLAITLFLLLAPQAASPGDAGLAPRPGEVLVTTPESFDSLDQDGSGFLEGDEAPTTVRLGGEVTLTPDGDGHTAYSADYIQLSRDPWRDSFYAAADTDRDTRISRDEYARWARGAMAEPAAVQSPSQ